MTRIVALFIGFTLLLPSVSSASVLAIGRFKGKGTVAEKQIRKSLCAEIECVAKAPKGKVKWRALERLGVTHVLSGKLTGSGVLKLSLVDSSNTVVWRKKVATRKGKLSGAALEKVVRELVDGNEEESDDAQEGGEELGEEAQGEEFSLAESRR